MIASAFQSIRHPILPIETKARASENSAENREDIQHEMAVIMHIRDHSLFTPRDFDVSPYFQIIKPTIEDRFDYRGVRWIDESH